MSLNVKTKQKQQFVCTKCSAGILSLQFLWTMNNLLSYCGLVDVKIWASDEVLPVFLKNIEILPVVSIPFVDHTSSISNSHPVPQQILLANSSSVQRRIPNLEHSLLAFENVSVEQSGILLSQEPPSKLQHLTALVWLSEIISWEFWMSFGLLSKSLFGQPDARPPNSTENK